MSIAASSASEERSSAEPTSAGTRPVIGITCYAEKAQWSVWDTPAVLVPAAYVRQVAAAGGIPVLLPPRAADIDVLGRLDGLLLTGGADLDPASYRASPDPHTRTGPPERDAAELALLGEAIRRDLPVLAVCRGLQVLNVLRGGTLHQHLPDVTGHNAHGPGPSSYGHNQVQICPGTRLATLLGNTASWSCHHHQAIDVPGEGLIVAARAADATIEAAELDGARFVLGVQGHPEVGDDDRLFRGLIAAASDAPQNHGR